MKVLRILLPVLVTIIATVIAIFMVIWLTSEVPNNEWAGLLKAAIIIFVIVGTLLVLAWSAYFTYVVRKSLEK
jgi:hypothetical protein